MIKYEDGLQKKMSMGTLKYFSLFFIKAFFFFYRLLFNHIKSLNKLSVKLNIHKYMLTTKK